MIFKTKHLFSLLFHEGNEGLEKIQEQFLRADDQGSTHYRLIFNYGGKYFEWFYERHYEEGYITYGVPETVECKEVFPMIKTIVNYE